MNTINRTILLITPRQPFIDWASSVDDDRPVTLDEKIFSTAYLIPDSFDELNYEEFLKKKFRQIFEHELDSWMTDPDSWPQKLTYSMFKQWFEVRVADMAIDLGNKPLVAEEY